MKLLKSIFKFFIAARQRETNYKIATRLQATEYRNESIDTVLQMVEARNFK